VVLDGFRVELVLSGERLTDQRRQQDRAEEEGDALSAQKPHRQRSANPTAK
jgi:hypothetical protein